MQSKNQPRTQAQIDQDNRTAFDAWNAAAAANWDSAAAWRQASWDRINKQAAKKAKK